MDRRTVERWQANRTVPRGRTRERLGELPALRDDPIRVLGTRDATREWLRARGRQLGGFTREEALKAGRPARVRADLDGLAAGVYQ